MARIIAALAIVASLTGCAWNQVVAWEPHSYAASAPRIAETAIMIGPGDSAAVSKAGGNALGRLTMKGDSGLESLHKAARIEAARLGGTHVFIASHGSEEFTGPRGYVTQVDPKVTYGVIRVPLDNWSELPPELAPVVYAKKK
jgi:hypothetical protein